MAGGGFAGCAGLRWRDNLGGVSLGAGGWGSRGTVIEKRGVGLVCGLGKWFDALGVGWMGSCPRVPSDCLWGGGGFKRGADHGGGKRRRGKGFGLAGVGKVVYVTVVGNDVLAGYPCWVIFVGDEQCSLLRIVDG